MKNILSKFFSGFTIFMMIMSFAGPVNVSAQVEDPITPDSEVIETPSDEVIDTTEEEIVEEAPAIDTEPTTPEEEGEKKEEVSELSRTALTIVDEPQTATISATKILCPSEDLLPNWGNYGDDITSTTADEFLNSSFCRLWSCRRSTSNRTTSLCSTSNANAPNRKCSLYHVSMEFSRGR